MRGFRIVRAVLAADELFHKKSSFLMITKRLRKVPGFIHGDISRSLVIIEYSPVL